MTKPKFTPGPWIVLENEITAPKFIYPKGGDYHLAEVVSRQDAHLIATAPEMYEKIEQLIYRIEDGLGPDEFDATPIQHELDELKSALKAARGEK